MLLGSCVFQIQTDLAVDIMSVPEQGQHDSVGYMKLGNEQTETLGYISVLCEFTIQSYHLRKAGWHQLILSG